MEENKTVKMEASKPQTEEKLNYADLENIAKQLSQQNQELQMKLRQAYSQLGETRLSFLMGVLEIVSKNSAHQFTNEFVTFCYNTVESALMPKKEDGNA